MVGYLLRTPFHAVLLALALGLVGVIGVGTVLTAPAAGAEPPPDLNFGYYQYPDAVTFSWQDEGGPVYKGSYIVTFAGQDCSTSAAGPAVPTTRSCTISNTNNAGGEATLTLSGKGGNFVVHSEMLSPLSPGSCGDLPRCIDAPTNFTAVAQSSTETFLNWQNHDGGETDADGYRVMLDQAGQRTQVCKQVDRAPLQDTRPPALSECLLDNLTPGTPYEFRVSHSGRGRAVGQEAVATITTPLTPARPADPTNLRVDAAQTSAFVSWNHPADSTAVRYGVWLSGPGLPTCDVRPQQPGRQSCRLDGLTPGTSYTVHVYAENGEGQRSESPTKFFTTGSDKPQPCEEGGRHDRVRDRKVGNAHTQYANKVNRATDRLEDRPKKLARKIRKLGTKRDQKIATAEANFARHCP